MSLQTLGDVQNIEDSACADLLRFSPISQGASPRFYCGYTQASYGPRTDRNLRVETAAGPAERCDHTDLRGVRPWLPSLLSVGEWVFLRLFSSLTFPTISSQTSAGAVEADCHCSVR